MEKGTHLVKVRDLCDVCKIDDSKVLDLLGDGVERFVHYHALGVPVMSKANDDNSIFLRFDGLIDVPT